MKSRIITFTMTKGVFTYAHFSLAKLASTPLVEFAFQPEEVDLWIHSGSLYVIPQTDNKEEKHLNQNV